MTPTNLKAGDILKATKDIPWGRGDKAFRQVEGNPIVAGDTMRYLGNSRVLVLDGDCRGMEFGLLITAPVELVA